MLNLRGFPPSVSKSSRSVWGAVEQYILKGNHELANSTYNSGSASRSRSLSPSPTSSRSVAREGGSNRRRRRVAESSSEDADSKSVTECDKPWMSVAHARIQVHEEDNDKTKLLHDDEDKDANVRGTRKALGEKQQGSIRRSD